MPDVVLKPEDWKALVIAAGRARKGLKPYVSADQADRLLARGYLVRAQRDATQVVVTPSGQSAAANYERSLRS